MDLHSWINSAGVVLSLAVTIAIFLRTNQSKRDREFVEIAFMVKTMWSAFMASGIVKGIDKGLLKANSPISLTAESRPIMASIRQALLEFREKECPDCDEKTLALQISERFKEELVQICSLNNGLQFEAAIIIATAIAKGKDTLTEILDGDHAPKKVESIDNKTS